MGPALVVQTAFLLILVQMLFGLAGFLVRQVPWAGLIVTALFVWFVVRTANVVRGELPRRTPLRGQERPFPLGLVGVGLIWQLPTLLAIPFWAPHWLSWIWQGMLLPVTETFGRWWPAAATAMLPWLWLAFLAEIALFVWVAGRPEPAVKRMAQVAAALATGPRSTEWVPAKRRQPKVGKQRPDLYENERDASEQNADQANADQATANKGNDDEID